MAIIAIVVITDAMTSARADFKFGIEFGTVSASERQVLGIKTAGGQVYPRYCT
jgi:hypothetical protein